MNFLLRFHSSDLRRCHSYRHQIRTLYDAVSSLQCPRDRGLDHAVERDKHLKPLLNLKNLIISEPSKSIPLSLLADSKETLGIPFRPIDFIRKYPSIFQEFHQGSLKIHPHIKLSPDIISLSSEEDLLYQSVNYKQDIAGRLLKLLMISRINKIPILLLERLKWELGLPQDYEKDLIPEFPDYFRVISENEKVLELVCWSDELAVSEMGKKVSKDGKIEFSLQFSKDFEMDKRYKKWLDEWQKLPYISPYENAVHLSSKSDESDKWSVAVLHEVLSLFVGKRADRESLLFLGEHLGLRSRFKLAFLQHPGIFYVSSKIGARTVVLKEAYKRGVMIKRHPLMDMRSKYIKLMNVEKGEEKAKTGQKKTVIDVKRTEGGELEDAEGEGEEEDDDEMHDSSDDQTEALEGENGVKRIQRNGAEPGGRNTRNVTRGTRGRGDEDNVSRSSSRFPRRTNAEGGDSNRTNRRGTEENVPRNSSRLSRRTNVQGGDSEEEDDDGMSDSSDDQMEAPQRGNGTKRGRFQRKGEEFDERNARRSVERRPHGRVEQYGSGSSSSFSRRSNSQGGDSNFPRRTTRNSDFNGNRNNGRDREENSFKYSSRPSRGFSRSTGYKSDFSGNGARSRTGSYGNDDRMKNFRGENGTKGGTFKRKGAAGFEERNAGRRTNGRGTEGNTFKSSSTFPRRSNSRGGDSNFTSRTGKNSDFSGNRARSNTRKSPM
ncbi:hypothetical protein ACS0TY_028699 [Phlomoides rotata]